MIEIIEKSKCCGCHACYNACPKNAITMQEDTKGFLVPVVDKNKCIDCKICEKVCPILNTKENNNKPIAYACYNKNETVRLDSSSGGIFTLIATYVIKNGGIVFGASFNNDNLVEHIEIDKVEDLYKLRGSKYVQSKIGDTYKKAKEYLENGRLVLFTGTPCQVEGLYSFLRKEYQNLYTQDIICHGVPSPKVWKEYLKYRLGKEDIGKIDINFRNKDNGWARFNLVLTNKEYKYKKYHSTDLYMRAFLKNISLRESCYNCSFKKENRVSDITLADFWGINSILPNFNDDKGVSLVMVNSNKGNNVFEEIKENILYEKVDFKKAISMNPSMTQSVKSNSNRESFFNGLGKYEFEELVNKYVKKNSIILRGVNFAKRMVKKIIGIK